jgi:preprotein translocase subunit SecD
MRTLLRDKQHPPRRHRREGNRRWNCASATPPRAAAARELLLADQLPDLRVDQAPTAATPLVATLRPRPRGMQEQALKQNITTLHNRVNELGVAEPVIQQQGLDRIVVQLPGVQDTAKAKDIIGRTATLEIRMVNESPEGASRARQRPRCPSAASATSTATASRDHRQAARCILTGENLTDAQAGFDGQTQEPACT